MSGGDKTKNNAAARVYRTNNREQINARARAKYAADPKAAHAKHNRWFRGKIKDPVFREKTNSYARKSYAKRRGIQIVATTGEPKPTTCCVCGAGGKICFDHCHAKGHFRGWLCNRCNLILGHAKDDPELLRKLAAYLQKEARLDYFY